MDSCSNEISSAGFSYCKGFPYSEDTTPYLIRGGLLSLSELDELLSLPDDDELLPLLLLLEDEALLREEKYIALVVGYLTLSDT